MAQLPVDLCDKCLNGRYKLVRKLGQGGMGVVYLAEDSLLANKHLAVKFVGKEILTESSIAELKNEFEVMTRLKHPNLARVYDFCYDDSLGRSFLTMEYVTGNSLKSIRDNRQIPDDLQIESILISLCRAVDFIHSRGLLHRDIKPANVFINAENTVKILDFGLADAVLEEVTDTSGTLAYLAPEALKGRFSVRSDIFSAAVTIFEYACGGSFYPIIEVSEIVSILTNEQLYTNHLLHQLMLIGDQTIRQILEKMLSYSPDERYGSFMDIIGSFSKMKEIHLPFEENDHYDAYLLGTQFINRKAEMDVMLNFVDDEQLSQKLHLLIGDPGIGKSRLLEELKKYCQLHEMLYFESFCQEHSNQSYQGFIKILRDMVLQLSPQKRALYGPILKSLLPQSPALREIEMDKTSDPQSERGRQIETITALILDFALSSLRPVVLAIDDIQWADEAAWNVFKELTFKLSLRKRSNLYIFTSSRSNVPALSQDAVLSLRAKERIIEIRLEPFHPNDMRILLENIFGVGRVDSSLFSLSEQISELTCGNPHRYNQIILDLMKSGLVHRNEFAWFATRLLSEEELSEYARADVKMHLPALNEMEKEALTLLALLNRHPTIQELSILLNDNESFSISSFIDKLDKFELIHLYEQRSQLMIRFTHAAYPQIISKDLSEGQKIRFHNKIVAGYERLKALSHEFYFDELAFHSVEGNLTEKMADYVETAAYHAKRNFSNQKAIDYFTILLERVFPENEEKQIEHLLNKASLLSIIGNTEESRELYERTLQLARKTESQDSIIEATSALANVLRKKGIYDKSLEMLEEMLEETQLWGNSKGTISILRDIAAIYQSRGDCDEAMKICERQLELSRAIEDKAGMAFAIGNIGVIHWQTGRLDLAMEEFHQKLDIMEELANPREQLVVQMNIGVINIDKDNLDTAKEILQEALETAEKIGDKKYIAVILGNLGIIYHKKGQFHQAKTCYERQLNMANELEDVMIQSHALGSIGLLHHFMGNLDEALRCLSDKYIMAEKNGEQQWMSITAGQIASLYVDMDDLEEARHWCDRAIHLGEKAQVFFYLCEYYLLKAKILFKLELFSDIDQNLEKCLEYAEQTERREVIDSRKLFAAFVQGKKPDATEEEKGEAIGIVEHLLAEAKSEDDRAYTLSVLAKLTDDADYTRAAWRLFNSLYEKCQKFDYAKKIKELSTRVKKSNEAKVVAPRRFDDGPICRLISEHPLRHYIQSLALKKSVHDVLETITWEYLSLGNLIYCSVLIYDETGVMRESVERTFGEPLLKKHSRLKFMLNEHVVNHHQAVYIPSEDKLSERVSSYTDLGNSIIIVYPLMNSSGSAPIGAVYLEMEQEETAEFPFESLNELAIHSAYALERSIREEHYRQSRVEWTRVYEISQALNTVLDLDKLLTFIVDSVIDLTNSERGFLMLLEKNDFLSFRIARDSQKRTLPETDFQISASIPQQVIKTGKTILHGDIECDSSFIPTESIQKLELKSILCVPLKVGRRILGVIYVDNSVARSNFNDHDRDLLNTIATAAAVAIQTAVLYDNLQQAHDELIKLDDMKSKFINLASHELRTPLTVITGYLDFLKQPDRLKNKKLNIVGILKEKVNKLNSLVNTIFDLSRLNKPEYPLNKVNSSIHELIHSLEADFRPLCEQREQDLTVFLPTTELFCIFDSDLMWQGLANIVLNAIRFTENKGAIEIHVDRSDKELFIAVKDTGIGIPEEEFSNIFKSFYKIEDVAFHHSGHHEFKAGGLGVGLAIAKNVVTLHQGTIDLASAVGQGTTFTVKLPLKTE